MPAVTTRRRWWFRLYKPELNWSERGKTENDLIPVVASRRRFQRRDHLPDEPVGLGLAVQIFCEHEFLSVARLNFQIMVNRMAGGRADIGGDAFDFTRLGGAVPFGRPATPFEPSRLLNSRSRGCAGTRDQTQTRVISKSIALNTNRKGNGAWFQINSAMMPVQIRQTMVAPDAKPGLRAAGKMNSLPPSGKSLT